MKKIKIMLLSLALFAVVGGALAFKARFINTYCTAQSVNNACNITCPTFGVGTLVDEGKGAVTVCTAPSYTTTDGVFGDIISSDCTTSILQNGQPVTFTAQCVATTTLYVD